MNKNELKEIALNFRKAFESAKYDDRVKKLYINRFPTGACGEVCDIIAEYLLNYKNVKCKIINGQFLYDEFDHRYSHTWIEIEDNLIIDITADQFKNNPIFENVKGFAISCYVGPKTPLHDLFEISPNGIQTFCGIDVYGDVAKNNLIKEYDVVMEYFYR